jgi:tRNA pseudouridine55 synthase
MICLDELISHAENGEIDSCLLPVDAGLASWPLVTLDSAQTARFSHGNPVACETEKSGLVRVYGPGNLLLGIAEVTTAQQLKPKRLMNLG